MRQKWLFTLAVLALLVGLGLNPAPAKAATVYCRNGDFAGLTYNSQGLHSYVQFNVGYLATRYGYNWGYSPRSVLISGTNIVLNTSPWPVDARYNYVRIGVQGNGLVSLGRPSMFRMCWIQSF